MKNKQLLQLKNNTFEFIRVTGNEDQFSDLKHFCLNDIKISYETCCVDDFWLITLDDALLNKEITVPNGDYIVRIPKGFTVIPAVDVEEYFNIIGEDDKEN